MALPSDLIDLLAEFAATGVEYLLVGGQALALHGHPRFTKDADVWLRDTTRVAHEVADTLVQVVGREQLIQLKKASGRPQDLLDAAQLEAGSRP